MKTTQNNNQDKKGTSKTQSPEIRDNLDSRKNEEQDIKGDDITNNSKETKKGKIKKDK